MQRRLGASLGLSTLAWSGLAWLAGGVLGALVWKKHRVLGFGLGAIVTGPIADKFIENRRDRWQGDPPPWNQRTPR